MPRRNVRRPLALDRLSARAMNCLRNANVTNLYELLRDGVEARMGGVKNCGVGTRRELQEAVEWIIEDLTRDGIRDIPGWVRRELNRVNRLSRARRTWPQPSLSR